MEVDLLEDCKGPSDKLRLLDVALEHVDRLDLLLGAHDGHGDVVPLVVVVRGGGEAVDLVIPEQIPVVYSLGHLLGNDVLLCFFLKFRLPIGLHSSCCISTKASGTFQKCFTKYHD